MLKKLLSQIGIGSAKVDLILDQARAKQGETLTGELKVQGGEVPQEINEITVDLVALSSYQHGDHRKNVSVSLKSYVLNEAFTIGSGETRSFPISLPIPLNIPVTSMTTRLVLQTNLDIRSGLDSNDRDAVQILPSGTLENFYAGFHALGMVPRFEAYDGMYQIVDFRPTQWLAGKLDELVFSYRADRTEEELTGYFEIDKKGTGLGGWLADEMDLDEKKGRYRFSKDQLATPAKAKETIRSFIETHYSRLM